MNHYFLQHPYFDRCKKPIVCECDVWVDRHGDARVAGTPNADHDSTDGWERMHIVNVETAHIVHQGWHYSSRKLFEPDPVVYSVLVADYLNTH